MSLTEQETQRLRTLLDKEEIREALLKYTRGVDRHDSDISEQAYHEGAIDDHGFVIGDGRAFVRGVNDTHAERHSAHHHYITNVTIDIDGDTAHAETYYFTVLRRTEGGMDAAGGRYLDRFERRDGRWAIAARVCLVEWNGEFDGASNPLPPDLFLDGTWGRDDISYQRPLRVHRPERNLRVRSDAG